MCIFVRLFSHPFLNNIKERKFHFGENAELGRIHSFTMKCVENDVSICAKFIIKCNILDIVAVLIYKVHNCIF